jgi:KRAB domain-containing zinc finger protein
MASKYIRNENGHFVCPNCEVVKKNQNTMYYHMKKHEGKLPFECDICKKDFVQKSSLEVHKLSKHKAAKKEVETFKCVFDNCEFESVTKANRRIHCLRKHFHDEVSKIMDDNNCSRCNKTFQSQTAFYYHVSSCIQIDDETLNRKLQEII